MPAYQLLGLSTWAVPGTVGRGNTCAETTSKVPNNASSVDSGPVVYLAATDLKSLNLGPKTIYALGLGQ